MLREPFPDLFLERAIDRRAAMTFTWARVVVTSGCIIIGFIVEFVNEAKDVSRSIPYWTGGQQVLDLFPVVLVRIGMMVMIYL